MNMGVQIRISSRPCFQFFWVYVTEHRSGCLLLWKPILERQVLMFIFRCRPPGRWGTHVTKPVSWEDRALTSPSPSPPLSGGRGVYKDGGEQNRDQSRGLKRALHAEQTERSPFRGWGEWRSGGCHPGLVIPASRHPGSIYEGQQISQSWDA